MRGVPCERTVQATSWESLELTRQRRFVTAGRIPPVRHAITSDGVRIAYWTLGNGLPLVYLAGGPWSHIELWQVLECQRWYARLSSSRMLVRYDMRGTGRSTRAVADFSLGALVRDVEAVVEGLGLERIALFGADAGPVTISYAARHPEQVEHLCPVVCLGKERGHPVTSNPSLAKADRSGLGADDGYLCADRFGMVR